MTNVSKTNIIIQYIKNVIHRVENSRVLSLQYLINVIFFVYFIIQFYAVMQQDGIFHIHLCVFNIVICSY